MPEREKKSMKKNFMGVHIIKVHHINDDKIAKFSLQTWTNRQYT